MLASKSGSLTTSESSVVRGMGARVLSGLTGNLSIPRETDSPAIGWVAENTALTADDANFDSITLSPKHAGALSEWSRNMLLQASPDVEALLRQMLARNLALAIDKAAILGGGTNEPKGVLSTVGIQTHAYATDLFTSNAEAISKADIANVRFCTFATAPTMAKLGVAGSHGPLRRLRACRRLTPMQRPSLDTERVRAA